MPQWRKLHAKFVDSEDVNDMPDDFTRLSWALMPIALDSEGRAQDDVTWLRSKLYPKRRDVSLEMIEGAMCWYATRRMIVRYTVSGRHYFYVPTFKLYQGKTDREAVSVIPEPPKKPQKHGKNGHRAQTTPTDDALMQSGPTHELVRTNSTLDVEEIKNRGDVEENREEPAAKTAPPARSRDLLFEAIAEVCGVDLSIPGAGRSVGAVSAALKKATPAYTPEEILAWGQKQGWRNTPPTVWQLKAGVSTIRRHGVARNQNGNAAAELRAAGYTDANGKPV